MDRVFIFLTQSFMSIPHNFMILLVPEAMKDNLEVPQGLQLFLGLFSQLITSFHVVFNL
jgi:hypothetical protein